MEQNDMFRATTEWMSQKYDEMNQRLFGGVLGKCDFGIFTSGKGSQGNALGHISLKGKNLKMERATKRVKVVTSFETIYVNRGNFYLLCKPTIELNGNYTGTEYSLLCTLVHEMCHYYTFMDGYFPKQAHGKEFREVCAIVASRSRGEFSISRLASEAEMNGYKLDDTVKNKRIKSLQALFVYKTDGTIKLTTTSSEKLIYNIQTTESERPNTLKIVRSNDPKLIELLFSSGYKTNVRSWSYWKVNNEPWIDSIQNYSTDTVYDAKRNTMESKKTTRNIIREVLDELMRNEFNGADNGDCVDITPDMNLSVRSPLEYEHTN